MEDKINLIQRWILIGFALFYGVSMLINIILAIFGQADLAVWHWPICAGVIVAAWDSLSYRQRASCLALLRRAISASKQVTRKVAAILLCEIRALRNLPALLSRRSDVVD